MKFLITLFFTLCFPILIFLTTILYATDITPILKTDLTQHHVYDQLSNQLSKLDIGNTNSAEISQFIQNKFTTEYIQHKVETAIDSSDDWIKGKSTTPPVVSFKDVKDVLNAKDPQLLPSIQTAADEMKKQEEQNPDLAQQNPQAAKNLDMISTLAKSDFTIPLTKYLAELKNFYATVRILQPILAFLLLTCLILLGVMNQSWRSRLKWIGMALLLSGILGFMFAFGNVGIINLLSKFAAHNSNHIVQLISPIILQLIKQYIDAYVTYQNIASVVVILVSGGCFIGMAFSQKMAVAPVNTKKSSGRRS